MRRIDCASSEGRFLNAPFDHSYEPLFVTLVGTLVFLGQDPHCVLEVRERGDGRLARIIELMRTCIHSGTCDGIIACLLDTFETEFGDVAVEIRRAARVLRKSAEEMKIQLGSSSLFRPSLFRQLLATATEIGINRGLIRRSNHERH